MPPIVHALLVGIDQYPSPAHRLSGCRNDVAALGEWLAHRVPAAQLRLRTLVDAEATRAAVIDAFRTHLGAARAGETALFYYAGHGSREQAPPEFWAAEPDRLDETLVLYDSREPGGWDLADKELAALLRPVAAAGAHLAVVIDACHSGSATRNIGGDPLGDDARPRVRRFPDDVRARPAASFLPEVQAVVAAHAAGGESGWAIGDDARHVLLAACRDDQEASEYRGGGGRPRGAFSYFLTEALRDAPNGATYRDVASGVRARVAAVIAAQMPQIEATVGADLDRPFLGGAVAPRPRAFTVAEGMDGEWWMDGGRIHGVPAPAGGEALRVAVFPATAGAADVARVDAATALAEAEVVDAARSQLAVTRGALARGATYKAVVIGAPAPTRRVRLTGDAATVDTARQALAGNPVVAEADAVADYVLDCAPGAFRLLRAADGRELVAPRASAGEAAHAVEHLARWSYFAELDNPLSGLAGEAELTLFAGATGTDALPGGAVRLEATREGGKLVASRFRVRFANRGARELYFALLALDETYACSADLVPAGVVRLGPGEEAWALGGKPLKSEVPRPLRAQGRTESRDVLKLVVSTAPFEPRHAELGPLDGVRSATRGEPKRPASTLDRLLGRGRTRTISADDDGDEAAADFCTLTTVVSTVEPPEAVPVGGAPLVDVGGGVRVEAHPALRAAARLVAAEQTRGDLGGTPAVPPIFRADDGGETIAFTRSRGTSPALSVLELRDVSDPAAVRPESPLRVRLPVALGADDVVVPFAFDGEDYLVLGLGGAGAAGGTRALGDGAAEAVVTIDRLPAPLAGGRRSLTGSIKILFQKLAAKALGAEYQYPLLAAARWPEPGGRAQYERDPARVRALVAGATRVVVFVHGIIGDTLAMGARLPARAGDVYLAYDYENLDTTIEENATLLGERLADAGLTPGHDKEVVVVAHSMGGLVARWWIEQGGGRAVVSRLVLCGTPNAGSPWSTIEDMAIGAATLALNNLTPVPWAAGALAGLLKGVERIDASLDQMRPGSGFLTQLAALGDPGVPYTVLAGNTALAAAADGERVKRVLKKVLHRTTSVAFLFSPNDVAVSVASVGAVGGAWASKPDVREVACDHMSYFTHEASLRELRGLLT